MPSTPLDFRAGSPSLPHGHDDPRSRAREHGAPARGCSVVGRGRQAGRALPRGPARGLAGGRRHRVWRGCRPMRSSVTRHRSAGTPVSAASLWIVSVRRRLQEDRLRQGGLVSRHVRRGTAERCIGQLPDGARYEVIADSGGHRPGGARSETAGRPSSPGWRWAASPGSSRTRRQPARARCPAHPQPAPRARPDRRGPARCAVARTPSSGGAEGHFMLGQLALAAEFQGDYDSKRMTDMARATFEGGGHVGNDPFGYRTVRDAQGNVTKPAPSTRSSRRRPRSCAASGATSVTTPTAKIAKTLGRGCEAADRRPVDQGRRQGRRAPRAVLPRQGRLPAR